MHIKYRNIHCNIELKSISHEQACVLNKFVFHTNLYEEQCKAPRAVWFRHVIMCVQYRWKTKTKQM